LVALRLVARHIAARSLLCAGVASALSPPQYGLPEVWFAFRNVCFPLAAGIEDTDAALYDFVER
jgi:hypothetical protein